ncbi:hypothetical protein M0804_014824 [Polistes exclamans]|nr:hypothetical protein M0804_014828 [Polistes exclamans]KAI4474501.1 hypothetical protein M0804_014824 [Polistes exclamans]
MHGNFEFQRRRYRCRGVDGEGIDVRSVQIQLPWGCKVGKVYPRLLGESGGSVSSLNVDHGKPTNSWVRPQFDDIAPKNITAIVGQTAELNCYVKHPGDRVFEYKLRREIGTIPCEMIIDFKRFWIIGDPCKLAAAAAVVVVPICISTPRDILYSNTKLKEVVVVPFTP